jgi:hypothetical protein
MIFINFEQWTRRGYLTKKLYIEWNRIKFKDKLTPFIWLKIKRRKNEK